MKLVERLGYVALGIFLGVVVTRSDSRKILSNTVEEEDDAIDIFDEEVAKEWDEQK